MRLELHQYQLYAIERTRDAIRDGARSVLIVSPTGSGKTVIGAKLVEESQAKGKHSTFVVDRISLIEQTSQSFDAVGLEHGVVQGGHWRNRLHLKTQLCSAQTLARRKWPDSSLDIIDEAHVLHKTVARRILERRAVTVGLTATPFTKGLGKYFDAVVNVTTTNQLIREGFLSPFRIFAGVEPDMQGVKVVAGEFDEKETSKRALQVVGNVVEEYLKHGEGRKFICSAVDTAHVDELRRQFLSAGINVAAYTYKERDEDRADTLTEFRKADSALRGIITVTAASRGFDCPTVSCIIMARPLRKSLAEHIQLLGRGLRIANGKKDCLVLDHSGNCVRMWKKMNHFFEHGIKELDDGKKKEKPQQSGATEKEPVTCPNCRTIHLPRPSCPHCGHEYPRRQSVQHVPGTLKELIACGNPEIQRRQLWPQVCSYVLESANGDMVRAQKRAQAIYHDMTGEFCRARIETTTPEPCSQELRNKIRSLTVRHFKRVAKANKGQPMVGVAG